MSSSSPHMDAVMTWEAWATVVTCAAVLLGLSLSLIDCAPAMVVSAVFLYLCQIVSLDDVLHGLSNPSVATIALLFIVVDPIADLPKVRRGVGRVLGDLSSAVGTRWATFKIVLLCMATSSFLNNTPQVAVLTNIIKLYCRDCGASPSQILLPMNFATLCGNYALIGTSTNLIVDGLMQSYGLGKMPFFELLKITGPFTVVMLLYLVWMPPYLLPLSSGGMFRTIRERGGVYLSRLRVRASSIVVGHRIGTVLNAYSTSLMRGVEVLQLQRQDITMFPVTGEERLEAGDVIMVRGDLSGIVRDVDALLGLECVPLTSSGHNGGGNHVGSESCEPFSAEEAVNQPPGVAQGVSPRAGEIDAGGCTGLNRHTDHRTSPTSPPSPDSSPRRRVPFPAMPTTDSTAEEQLAARSFAFGGQALVNVTAVVPVTTEVHTTFFEAVLGPRAAGLGTSVASGHFQLRYNVYILAVRSVDGLETVSDLYLADLAHHVLGVGDTLLLLARENFREEQQHISAVGGHNNGEFIAINEIESSAERHVEEHYMRVPGWIRCVGHQLVVRGAPMRVVHVPQWYPYLSLPIFLIMLGFAIANYELAVLALIAAIAVVGLGLTTTHRAIASVEWEVIIMVAFSFTLATAMTKSGFSSVVAQSLRSADVRGIGLLYLIAALATIMTNVITNKACVQVLVPIVVATYREQGSDPLPAVMMTCALASMALSTPYGFATNLMVMGPGGYRPVDFIKFGLPLNILATALLPIITAVVYQMDW